MHDTVSEQSILQSMNIFMAKRNTTDANLVDIVANTLKEFLGDIAYNEFKTDPNIISIMDSIPEVQRVIINRYFIIKLFIFRNNNNIDILGVLSNLISDGTYVDWFFCFKTYVLPFLKDNHVLVCLK